MTVTENNINNSNSIVNNTDKPTLALRNFKLPKLIVKTDMIQPDRKVYRNKLKLSMSMIPELNLDRIATHDDMYYRNHNNHHQNQHRSRTGPSEIIVDGVSIQRLHSNLRVFNISSAMAFNSLPNILFLDYHHHEYTFWNDLLFYIHNTVHINSIFVNEYENHTTQYYRSESTFWSIIRDHIFMQTMVAELMNNQMNNSINDKYYVVIDQITNSLQQINEIRQLMYNGRHYRVGQLHRITHGTKIRPEFRSNFDFVILNPFHINTNNLRRIYQNYFNIFPTFDIFRSLVDELRHSREFIIINMRHNSHNIYDRIFKVPLNVYPSISLGHNRYN